MDATQFELLNEIVKLLSTQESVTELQGFLQSYNS